jgi:hypothetical protein
LSTRFVAGVVSRESMATPRSPIGDHSFEWRDRMFPTTPGGESGMWTASVRTGRVRRKLPDAARGGHPAVRRDCVFPGECPPRSSPGVPTEVFPGECPPRSSPGVPTEVFPGETPRGQEAGPMPPGSLRFRRCLGDVRLTWSAHDPFARFRPGGCPLVDAVPGQPVAVVLNGDGLDEEAMQRVARWTSLVASRAADRCSRAPWAAIGEHSFE